jgi:hypothetical protein
MRDRVRRIHLQRGGRQLDRPLRIVRLQSEHAQEGQRRNVPGLHLQHTLISRPRFLEAGLPMMRECLAKESIRRSIGA